MQEFDHTSREDYTYTEQGMSKIGRSTSMVEEGI